MLNYHKCDLIDECVSRYLKSFSVTLDAVDFVPKPYLRKILRYIFKNLKRHFRKVDGADRRYQRELIKKLKQGVNKKLESTSTAKPEATTEASAETIAAPTG